MSTDVHPPARPNSVYPVLYTADVATASDFYVRFFGFEATFTSDWYVSLRHAIAPEYELAFLANDHPSIPEPFRGRITQCLLNVEVADATAEADRLAAAGVPVVQPLRDEPFGQRHVIAAAPDGVLIDVIEEIPPSPEYAMMFAGETHRES